jgi:hypothetical protein
MDVKFECAKADLEFIAAREQFLAAQASGDRQWIKRAAVALAHADKRRAVAAVLSRRWSTGAPSGAPQTEYFAEQPASANDNPEMGAARDASRSAALARGAKQRQPKPEAHSLSPGMTRMRRPSVGRSGGGRGPFKSAN